MMTERSRGFGSAGAIETLFLRWEDLFMRMFVASLALVVAGSLFAGCSGSADRPTEPTPEQAEAIRKAKEILQKKKKPGAAVDRDGRDALRQFSTFVS
jgi:hypothetical protein